MACARGFRFLAVTWTRWFQELVEGEATLSGSLTRIPS